MKDSRGDAGNVQFLLPGEGRFAYIKMLQLIAAQGYTGDIVVEVGGQISNQRGYDPLVAVKRCYRNLAPALAAAGMERG